MARPPANVYRPAMVTAVALLHGWDRRQRTPDVSLFMVSGILRKNRPMAYSRARDRPFILPRYDKSESQQ